MFHQTISAILLRICSLFRTTYERNGIVGQWNRGIKLAINNMAVVAILKPGRAESDLSVN